MSNFLFAESTYLPDHQALLIQADLSDYLIDYFLQRAVVAPETTPERNMKLRDLIACFAIHLMVRPPKESHAWTIHVVDREPYSLFVAGQTEAIYDKDAATGAVVGNLLTENIRHTDVNAFHAQYVGSTGTVMRSYVQCEDTDIAKMVEWFYRQSEQFRLRINLPEDSDQALGLAALPGCATSWFEAADLDALAVPPAENRKIMRRCRFSFVCDCSPEKLLPFFRSLPPERLSELYGEDLELIICCPRCGRRFAISRTALVEH